jgi:2-(1,2-epoxy-1,2-dihydrophenyl)acetyl-CoA isomerase
MESSKATNNASCASLLIEDHGPVRQIILNRPDTHNSLSLDFTRELLAALEMAAQAPSVRALVISANGTNFCSGGDLKEMLTRGKDIENYIDEAMRTAHNPLVRHIAAFPYPVVHAVQGTVVGAGVGLAFAADMTLAATTANFVLPFVPKLAIVPDVSCSWQLVQSLGYRRALGHVLTGQPLSAAAAQAAGLVWDCVAEADLQDQALSLAQQLSQLSPDAVQRNRRLLSAAAHQDLSSQLELEHRLQCESFAHPASREGLSAIQERRPPNFNHRKPR